MKTADTSVVRSRSGAPRPSIALVPDLRPPVPRTPPLPAPAKGADGDRLIVLLILVVGAIRPLQALLRHERWGSESVLGLLMVVIAIRALVVDALLRWRRRD